MEAPIPKTTPDLKNEFDYKINVNEKFFQFNLTIFNNSILFKFSNVDDFPPLIYEEEYNLEKLKKDNLLFSLYNSINDIILYLDANIKENKYFFDINDKEVIFIIKTNIIGIPDIKLLIKKKEINEKLIISNLCNEVKKLKEKIQKIENLELNNNNNNNNNKKIPKIKIVKQYKNYENPIYGINIFPNGNFISYSGNNKKGSSIFLYKKENKKRIYNIKSSHKKAISYLEIIDNNNFITSSFDKTIIIWNINGIIPKIIQNLEGHSGKVFKVIFINSKLISCGENGEIFIWENKEEKYYLFKKIDNLNSTIYNILQINLNEFISCDNLGNLICWNYNNYSQKFKMNIVKSKWNNGIVKIDENKILIGGVDKIQIVNLKQKIIEKEIFIHKRIIFSLNLLFDNYFITGDNLGNIELREIDTLKDVKTKFLNYNEIIYSIRNLNDNFFIVSTKEKNIYLMKYINVI